METKKPSRKFPRQPPHKKLSPAGRRLTASARKLYNRIAEQMDCCTKTIKRARKLLFERGDLIVCRTLPRTWSCWAKTHPAVKRKAILYFKGGYIDNPFFEPTRPKTVGGQNVPSEGTNCPLSRKNVVALKGYIPKGAPDKGSRALPSPDLTSEGVPSEPPKGTKENRPEFVDHGEAAPPQTPPAAQKNKEENSKLRRKFERLQKERTAGRKKYQQKKYFPT